MSFPGHRAASVDPWQTRGLDARGGEEALSEPGPLYACTCIIR
jgi:hypothetical protein